MLVEPIIPLLERALAARADLFDDLHFAAFRLFNGFLESPSVHPARDLVIDLYAKTLVLFNYADDPQSLDSLLGEVQAFFLVRLPWLQSVVIKTRTAVAEQPRRGVISYGDSPSRKVRENGVWYAVDLTLNLDASLYLDTRNLRAWAVEHLAGKRVLNTFAYTGSLGVAALAAGAHQVIQTDLNRRFLNLAKDSYALNGFPVQRADFRSGDFWVQMNALKRAGELYDCVFVDPPFFSITERGRVDLVANSQQVLNKVRPLVGHTGYLVSINNALFLSGADYLKMLQSLCADGYLSIEELISVPPDAAGYAETRVNQLPVDPAPFNHSTKIAVLRVTRKDQRTAQ